MEFSGHDPTGKRVMGLLPAKGLATSVDADKRFLWEVPSNWYVPYLLTQIVLEEHSSSSYQIHNHFIIFSLCYIHNML